VNRKFNGNGINEISGLLSIPGDKSISHRAVMFAALAKGKSTIKNCLLSEDVHSTINCFRQLGVKIEIERTAVTVWGNGFGGLSKPTEPLDAGNSGTTARLLSGILAMQSFSSTLIGDVSLSKRPMERIITPLKMIGAYIASSKNGTLPLKFSPSNNLRNIEYKMPVASAQVKSSILLAGLFLDDTIRVIELVATRNHTENLLQLKVESGVEGKTISVSRNDYPAAKNYIIPSDISTASFFIVLTLLTSNSKLVLKNILANETRNGIINILQKMGGSIRIENVRKTSGESFGDIVVSSSVLHNIRIAKEIIPNIIDEIPILSIAGFFAKGKFTIVNAGELRKKESDRISSICENFKILGANVEEYPDGFSIDGKQRNTNLFFNSFADHRIAMSFAVLSLLLKSGGTVKGFECTGISNPEFLKQLSSIIK